jgi:hypothetical protein
MRIGRGQGLKKKRRLLAGKRDAKGIGPAKIKRVCGCRMRLLLGMCVLALLLLPRPLAAQVLSDAVLNSTVWISYEVTPAATDAGRLQVRPPEAPPSRPAQTEVYGGTGFLFFQGVGIGKGRIFLVTNKHVLPPEGKQQDIKVRVAVRDKDGAARVEAVTVPVVGKDGKYLDSVRLHPDPDTDVAAVNIAMEAFGAKFQLLIDALMTGKYLNTSMLMTSERIRSSNIGMGSPVYIIGFPDAIFDPRNVSPVLRAGIIATDPREGFNFNEALRRTIAFPEHVNGFLIDANIYPGSSGSLVVLGQDGQHSGPEAKRGDWQPTILGIVAGSIPMLDASLHSYARIGLGIVYSADSIRDVIRLFDRR